METAMKLPGLPDSYKQKKFAANSGQALVIILLILAVALTIGLSIVSRSFVDIQISQQEEESTRAFSIAEAGLEEALRLGQVPPGGVTVETEWGAFTAHVSRADFGAGSVFNFGGEFFEEGDVRTLWLVGHNSDGEPDPIVSTFPVDQDLTVCFGEIGTSEVPALALAAFFQSGGDFSVTRVGFDLNEGANDNEFLTDVGTPTDADCASDYQYQLTLELDNDMDIPAAATIYALRLKLLYNNDAQPMLVKAVGVVPFPSQGSCYESTATIPTSGVTRKIQHCRYFEAPPGIFDYVLFSEQDLVK